jgi:hypothetical protein
MYLLYLHFMAAIDPFSTVFLPFVPKILLSVLRGHLNCDKSLFNVKRVSSEIILIGFA